MFILNNLLDSTIIYNNQCLYTQPTSYELPTPTITNSGIK